MADYIYKLGNFNTDYITSAFVTEGYVDFINCDSDSLTGQDGEQVIVQRERTAAKRSGKAIYDFAFIPDVSFLSNADPLLKNCELKLRFDRADPKVCVLKKVDEGTLGDIEITDCYAVTEYIS